MTVFKQLLFNEEKEYIELLKLLEIEDADFNPYDTAHTVIEKLQIYDNLVTTKVHAILFLHEKGILDEFNEYLKEKMKNE